MKNLHFYLTRIKYIGTIYLFFLAIGCEINNRVIEPTHFDIRKMSCFFRSEIYPYMTHWNDRDGKYLGLAFDDSMRVFNASMLKNNSNNLYASHQPVHNYLPTEVIEKIIIIAEKYNDTLHSGDTINHITNIAQLLDEVDYQAQQFFYVSFDVPHTESRHLRVEYYQKNGEHYSCEVKD